MKRKRLAYRIRLTLIEKTIPYLDAFKYFLPNLKKAGSNYKCKSPFIHEKTASFLLNDNKKIWHCFSSGIGGTHIVSYVMNKEAMSFGIAIEYVESCFGLCDAVANDTIMIQAVSRLKTKVAHNGTMINIYDAELHNFINILKNKFVDEADMLNDYYVYIWDVFKDMDISTYDAYKHFIKWVYVLIKHTHIDYVTPLNSMVYEYRSKNK